VVCLALTIDQIRRLQKSAFQVFFHRFTQNTAPALYSGPRNPDNSLSYALSKNEK
jgi:hypothetical protein